MNENYNKRIEGFIQQMSTDPIKVTNYRNVDYDNYRFRETSSCNFRFSNASLRSRTYYDDYEYDYTPSINQNSSTFRSSPFKAKMNTQ